MANESHIKYITSIVLNSIPCISMIYLVITERVKMTCHHSLTVVDMSEEGFMAYLLQTGQSLNSNGVFRSHDSQVFCNSRYSR